MQGSLLLIAFLPVWVAGDAYLCDRSLPPAIYWLEEPSLCSDSAGTPVTLDITTLSPNPYKVKGWIVELFEFSCTTHFFFWGSYSSTHSMSPKPLPGPPSTQPGCPSGYHEYKEETDLQSLCRWNWPQETMFTALVCRVSVGTLENTASGYYVNGVRASCQDYTCVTDSGQAFIHTTSIAALDMQTSHTQIEDATCTPEYCIVPRTMSLYKALSLLPPLKDWDAGFLSSTGEHIYLRGKEAAASNNTNTSLSSRSRRDTSEDIRKILYLEEETLRLSHKTDVLCQIIQQLRSLFWVSSGSDPTTLARQALNKSNIVAETRGPVILVWGCNTADRWEPVPSKQCHEHLKVTYWTQEDKQHNKTGYLDPKTGEIMARSPLQRCRTHYILKGSKLFSVTNGSMTLQNNTYPFLRAGSMSGAPSYNPPSWERETTAASSHKTPVVTYEDLGRYQPEEETLGSYLHHIHNRDMLPFFICASLLLLWGLILAPILKLRRDLKILKDRQDLMMYISK